MESNLQELDFLQRKFLFQKTSQIVMNSVLILDVKTEASGTKIAVLIK